MKKEFINQIQKKEIIFLKKISRDKSLDVLVQDGCSELSRLVGLWFLEKRKDIKASILKGERVFNKNQCHDVLMIEKEKEFYLIDPTIWQFFKNKKSIFIGSFKNKEDIFKGLKKEYGGNWKVSERINKRINKEELVNVIAENIKMKNNIIKNLEKKYKGKKVLVWGLGLHGGGVGTVKFFSKLGAKVLVIDMKSKEQLKKSLDQLKNLKNVSYHFGEHKEIDFQKADFIIRNPDIREENKFLKVAKKAGVRVENDVGIFFENSPSFKIGITGTKGKSTITSMIYELVKYEIVKNGKFFLGNNRPKAGPPWADKVFLGGNIRKSVFDCLEEADDKSIVVLELSSAQLDHAKYAKRSPNVAVITNIYPEHIPFHGTLPKYIEAKKTIYKYQKKNDYLIADKKIKNIIKGNKSKTLYFNGENNKEVLEKLAEVFKISKSDLQKVISNFHGIEGAQELVGEVGGVRFINDTRATHPAAVLYALDKFKKPILILGGKDKGFGDEVKKLANKIEKQKIYTILLIPGSFSDKMITLWSESFRKKYLFPVGSMKDAVKKAYSLSKRGDTVLLSPGGSSFDLFVNEFDRGDKFIEAIKKIKK
jgi:UDP-N-acetylmuramoylalanine--D-glutamate ligase